MIQCTIRQRINSDILGAPLFPPFRTRPLVRLLSRRRGNLGPRAATPNCNTTKPSQHQKHTPFV